MKKTAEISILNSMVQDISVKIFKEKYLNKDYYHETGDLNRFFDINGISKARDVDTILKFYKNPVMVVGDVAIEETGGILNKFLTTPEKAKDYYNRGAALEFDFANLFINELDDSLRALKNELNLPEGTLTKSVLYAAPKGGGFSAHFDGYSNFIFQLKGKKHWKIASNFNVKNSLHHYELIDAPHVPYPLNRYWEGDFPDKKLSHGDNVILNTGSFLYLPRGHWHSTESNEETIALNFTIGQPSLLDLFLAEIKKQLISNEEWRTLATNPNITTTEELIKTEEQLKQMILEFNDDLLNIKLKDILDRHTEDFDTYQSTQMVFRQLQTIVD